MTLYVLAMSSFHQRLKSAINELSHLESPSLDSEVILSFVLDKPKEYLLTHPDEDVPADVADKFSELIRQRAGHKPVAYLTRRKEFYGRDFYVDQRSHIPRPATEDLIDFVKEKIAPDFNGAIADISTGSGCIAVTLALEYPQAVLIATDISADALSVARQNAAAHKVADKIDFRQGDLLAPLNELLDIIVSNPPYGWLRDWSDDPEIKYQPKISYDGGKDGLQIIKRLIEDAPSYLKNNGQLFFEFDPRQRADIEKLLFQRRDDPANAGRFYKQMHHQIKKDLSGFDRIVRLC